jgi:polyhydroxybutyrate depolymerase
MSRISFARTHVPALSCRRILLIVAFVILVLIIAVVATTAWMVGPAVRCILPKQASVEAGWSARTLVSGGQDRCYYVYAPPGYDAAGPAPVVFSFHGFLSNPESQALITGWHKLADQEGFVVAYPQGKKFPQRWNAGATWGDSDVDDVRFFRDMLEDLSTTAAIDRSRVYINGFSNGGGMTVRLGCDAADLLAAMGTVAGAVVSMDDCKPSRPVPAMAFHGTADPIVPYEGGQMHGRLLRWASGLTNAPTYFVGAEDWVAMWAASNGCDPTPATIPPMGDAHGVRYAGCDDEAAVAFFAIDGGGHTWPGGWPIPGVGKTSQDIDATEQLWEFFQGYRLEGHP